MEVETQSDAGTLTVSGLLGAIENVTESPTKPSREGKKARGGHIHKLTVAVKRRLLALKKLEYESIKQEVEYFVELHALEMKYQKIFAPYDQRRSDIVNGETEPEDTDCDWSSDESETEKEKSPLSSKSQLSANGDDNARGIPGFWLHLLENRTFLIDQIQDHDRLVLKHLKNVRAVYLPHGYRLDFVFGDNEYFTDDILSKKYYIDFSPFTARGKKLTYYGPVNIGFEGCAVNWKDGKDVTKIPGPLGNGFQDSFFNFFGRTASRDPSKGDDETCINETCVIEREFEFVRILRQNILPRAASVYAKNYFADLDGDDDLDSYVEEEDEDYDPRME